MIVDLPGCGSAFDVTADAAGVYIDGENTGPTGPTGYVMKCSKTGQCTAP